MTTTINWAKLVEKNRAKAHGIPWTDEENKAIQSGISPDDVRAGILTKKDAKEDKDSIERMSDDDLKSLAKKLKIEFLPDAVNRNDLISEIKKAQKTKKKDGKKKKAEGKKKKGKAKKKAGK